MRRILPFAVFILGSIFNHEAQAQKTSDNDVKCLADNIWYEGANQSRFGWLAIGNTTLNRFRSGDFGYTLCEVVYQRTGKICQFTWTCSRQSPPTTDMEIKLYTAVSYMAQGLIAGRFKDNTDGALYYHTTSIRMPDFFKGLERITRIDDHIFYRLSRDSIKIEYKTKW